MSNVAFVTGAASGFGLCTTRRLLARSWKVAMVDYSPSGDVVAASLAKEFPTASCRFYRCDVSDSLALERTFKAAAAALGPFQFVFNNAGVTEKPDFADYKRVVDINLNAVIQGTALAIEHMKGRGGVIVNTASIGGLFVIPFSPVYAATKAAVVHFTRSLGYLGQADNIRITAICPGFADTPLIADSKELIGENIAISGGLLTADRVADDVLRIVEWKDRSLSGAVIAISAKAGTLSIPYSTGAIIKSGSKL